MAIGYECTVALGSRCPWSAALHGVKEWGGLFLASLQCIQAVAARAVDGQPQKGAGDGQVFHEHDHLHLIAELLWNTRPVSRPTARQRR